jgi:NAD(P)H-dependent FMN reductase
MITVIAGTNRKGSETAHFAKHLFDVLKKESKEDVKFLDLQDIPHDWFHSAMYAADTQTVSLAKIQDDCILPAEKFIFVIPEYNGGFPGVVKMFIDACSVRNYADNFKGKKAAIVGVAAGRAGNLRGMEHLTGVLNYLGTTVMPNRLPISSIGGLLDKDKNVKDKETIKVLQEFSESVVKF